MKIRRAMLAAGFEKVERAASIGVEIVERNCSGAVVGGLSGSVNKKMGGDFLYQGVYALPVADVQLVMRKVRESCLQTPLVPPSVPLRPEKNRALVIVHSVYFEAAPGEINTNF